MEISSNTNFLHVGVGVVETKPSFLPRVDSLLGITVFEVLPATDAFSLELTVSLEE